MVAVLSLAAGLIVTTTVVHALFMLLSFQVLGFLQVRWRERFSTLHRAMLVAAFVLVMFVAGIVEAQIWAAVYWGSGLLSSWEEAAYFSMVTFTSLGYGDIVLDPPWRIVAALEAAMGLIVFGWTVALVFEVVRHLFALDRHDD